MSHGRKVVLMLHSVVPAAELDERLVPRPRQEIATQELRALVRDARDAGWGLVPLAELLDGPASSQDRVSLTFDDGYRDFHEHALPVLREAAVPSTLFVTTGYPDRTLLHVSLVVEDLVRRHRLLELHLPDEVRVVDCADPVEAATVVNRLVWQAGLDSATDVLAAYRDEWVHHGLTWEQLHDVASDDLTAIGGHTVSHPFLDLADPASATREVHADRERLRSVLGVAVDHFAYPFGRSNGGVVDAVRDAGYGAAVTTQHRDVAPDDERFLLPRRCVESGRPFRALVDD